MNLLTIFHIELKKIRRTHIFWILLIPLIYIMPHIIRSDQTMAVYMAEPIADFLAVTFTAVLFAVQFKKTLKKIGKAK